MRTTIGVYKQLLKFLEVVDSEAEARGEGPEDKSIDPHFRSGVYLGNGVLNLTLSLMPGKLQTLVELLGYKGDRQVALMFLAKSGGWSKDSSEPAITIGAFVTTITVYAAHIWAISRKGGRSSYYLRYLSTYLPFGIIKFHI